MGIIHHLGFIQTQRFGNWICFCHQVISGKEKYLLSWARQSELILTVGPSL
jgi:hypothetical protein